MSHTRPSRVLRAVGMAVWPAVLLLCCAGRADAGCGDYVQIVGPDGTVQAPDGHHPVPAKRPCQGPECTGGPKAPAPVPPAPTVPTSDVKGLVTDAGGSDGPGGAIRPASDPGGLPARQPRSIFHPPRAS